MRRRMRPSTIVRPSSTATTRAMSRAPERRQDVERLLAPDRVVRSPETRLDYRIDRLLGHGGFGQAYLARRLGRSSIIAETVCIKISGRIDGWVREAYFG